MRYGKAPPSPWYFTMPQGYDPGIYPMPHPTHPGKTLHLHGLGTAGSTAGFGLALAVTAGIALAAVFTVLVTQKG